jgi:hypothetical protein
MVAIFLASVAHVIIHFKNVFNTFSTTLIALNIQQMMLLIV